MSDKKPCGRPPLGEAAEARMCALFAEGKTPEEIGDILASEGTKASRAKIYEVRRFWLKEQRAAAK